MIGYHACEPPDAHQRYRQHVYWLRTVPTWQKVAAASLLVLAPMALTMWSTAAPPLLPEAAGAGAFVATTAQPTQWHGVSLGGWLVMEINPAVKKAGSPVDLRPSWMYDQIEANSELDFVLKLRDEHGDAYAIQTALYQAKLAEGRKVIGWKIGLTSKAMQSALGIDIPDSGILFDDMLFQSGAEIPKGRFIQPRMEAEIAFVMKAPLGGAEVTRADVLAATDYVTPAIEILDTRILRADPATGQTRKVFDTISDNAANAGIVLGTQQHSPDQVDLRWVGAMVFRNGEIEETGLGAGVLNDPAESVVWLARRMSQYGQKIEAGQVILSGSFIRPVECPSGAQIIADYGSFGTVSVDFA